MQKSYYPKAGEIVGQWHLVDASGQNLGRLATRIAGVLLGKHRPNFTPGVDLGDFVIVTNCEKVTVTGNKLTDKIYRRHSGYPGGLKETTARQLLARFPERVIEEAVGGMLPKSRLGKAMVRKLKVYRDQDHPHRAQQPVKIEI